MKKFRLRFATIICLLAASFLQMNAAKNLYLSSKGSDTNDGLTAATAVKTLGKIHTLIGVGDIIHVDGLIDISLETKGSAEGTNLQQGPNGNANGGFLFRAGIWHNSKMIGTDPEKDGFTSHGDGRLLRIDGGTHTFENLLFTEGADIGDDGGCGLWLRSSVNTFNNCHFVGNKAILDAADPTKFQNTNGRGGAVHIMNGTTSFKNCYFAENANTLGAAIFTHGGTIDLLGCTFEEHDLSGVSGSKGGVLYIWSEQAQPPVITIDRCVFRNNTVSSDGGAITMNNLTDRDNNKTVMKITNSAFIKNEAVGNGGAFHLNNTRLGTNDTIVIANTTFFGNIADRFGGAIYLGKSQPNSIFTMVNSSVIANYTRGNGGFGAGLTVYNDNTSDMLKRIYNCIFDKNASVSQDIYSDFNYRLPEGLTVPGQNANDEKELIISNTFISTTLQGNGVSGAWFTNANYPGNNINYSDMAVVNDALVSTYHNASGIDDDPDFYLQQSDFPVYAVPLKEDAAARTYGKTEYLALFGIEATDQLGKTRTISGTACAVGATEATSEEIDNETFEYPIIVSAPNGIEKFRSESKTEFIIAGDVISLINAELKNVALVLYNALGTIVKTGTDKISANGLPSGLYIVKANVAGKNLTQKIIK